MGFVSPLSESLKTAGFEHFGWTRLTRPLSMDIYKTWIEAGHQASMSYLKDHVDLKEFPSRFAPRATSAIVVAKRYLPHPYSRETAPLSSLRTALYAKGQDYHLAFRAELESAAENLRSQFTDHEFLCFTDSAPILERDLAYRAGLGWVGKNSCLIHPQQGSLFFLGEILTSLPLDNEKSPHPDMCGTCDRCIQACPTGAITKNRTLISDKCISYWNIEAKESPPASFRESMSDWFFGCDICQTVCPWNEKVFGRENMKQLSTQTTTDVAQDNLVHDLRWVLSVSGGEIERQLRDLPLVRARPFGLKRNALLVIANRKIQALSADVERLLDHPRLKDLAEWTLAQLRSGVDEHCGIHSDPD